MEDHLYARGDARAVGDFVGAAPPPPPPSPPAAAIGIDYGAGGDYDGAPGLPTAIRLVQEDNIADIRLHNARVSLLRVFALLTPDELRRRLRHPDIRRRFRQLRAIRRLRQGLARR
ncbi:uncharacterized protein LOC130205989 isoform X1 [Pseudoliparis swirei]|uniref:uncharacterized protein LOC130205989 isoform X1 n=1 Tax=Pseudoliparis swirei TaxID=2059687 RepID=UPI0024BDB8A4|nr:uncharacterized protein LOC130205989 isoform X1 [Pseudoliparis swirei]